MTLATMAVLVTTATLALAALFLLCMWVLGGMKSDPAVAQGFASLGIDPGPVLANQPILAPWVDSTTGGLTANYFDPTAQGRGAQTPPQVMNESGFLLGPLPAPVSPITGRLILTNIDVCSAFGHQAGATCPRCGTIVNAVQPVV